MSEALETSEGENTPTVVRRVCGGVATIGAAKLALAEGGCIGELVFLGILLFAELVKLSPPWSCRRSTSGMGSVFDRRDRRPKAHLA